MAKFGGVTGDVTGKLKFKEQCTFQQGLMGMNTPGDIVYVDKNKTTGVSGDGSSYDTAFMTVTEGLAILENYDTLIIAPGNYDELAKMELSDVKGVKIFGFGTGMQWNEGSTTIRDVSHTVASDLLDLTGNQAVEIAGISFIITQADKDAINFTGLNYSTHIHNCSFVGNVGGSDVMAYAVNIAGSNGPDTYIHDCKFDRIKTAAIIDLGQRNVITNNVFIVPNAGKGIHGIDNVKGFNIITDNYFLGHVTDGYGIYDTAGTAGNFLIANNLFANFNTTKQINVAAASDANCLNNYMHGANGAITVANPSP